MTDAVPTPDLNALTPYEQAKAEGRTVLDLRQQGRMADRAGGPLPESFDPRLPYELALEMDEPLNTFAKYGYNADEATVMLRRAGFAAAVRKYRDEIVAGGVSFKLKAKVQAEALLADSYEIATDPEAPASVRADLIKWTAAVAGFGPPKEAKDGGGGGAGAGFALNITFSGPAPAGVTARPAIDVTPVQGEDT